ncbi:histamine H1 receptor-like [Macrobrachium rosenbergii]|uniref:histamine H1 receptor-like n=1 Tax=Macrobrachium rosenbergii TaxID=79674 RepID=UPI0034D655BA
MNLQPYSITEIDTTPFKTYDELSSNSSQKARAGSHGMIPNYGSSSSSVGSRIPSNKCTSSSSSGPCNHTTADVFPSSHHPTKGLFHPKDVSYWNPDINRPFWKLDVGAPGWNVTDHRPWNGAGNETNKHFPAGENISPVGENIAHSNVTVTDAGGFDGIDEWSTGLLAVTGISLYTLALCTAVGNALVIHAIRTEKRLQTVSNLFIMSLAAADLTVGVIVMPISAAYAMMGNWKLGLPVCQFWLAADYTASTASIFNLVILSLDRYWSITAPLRYLRRRTRRRAWVMIGASWAAAMAWLVPVLAWHHLALDGIRHQPEHVCETEFTNNVPFKAVTAALNFYLPSALMLYLYCRIFREIQTRQALGRVNFSSHDVPNDSCSEVERVQRHIHGSKNSQPHDIPTITTTAERSQFRSLTIVTPGRHDCSHFSGVTVSVEYLPEDSGQSSPTLNHQYPNQQSLQTQQQSQQQQQLLQQQQLRRQNTNRLSPHHNHIHCYQSTTRPHSSWDPSNDSNKWRCSWRLSSMSRTQGSGGGEGGITPGHASSSEASTNGTGKKRSMGCANSNAATAGRRMEGVNLAKERKAARQLGVIVGAFMACWVPYFTLFPIMALCDNCVPPQAHTATIWLGYLNSTLNPVLYPLCNHNFRRAFARMLRLPLRKPHNQANAHRVATITIGH